MIKAINVSIYTPIKQKTGHTLAELAVNLATQHVEHVSRAGHVDNLHVAVLVLTVELVLRGVHTRLLVTELQPTLHPARRVLWTLAIVTMRQRKDKTGTLQPLRFTSSNELVNDALSVVGKVTKLSLPHDESVRRGKRVTVFETKAANVSLIECNKKRKELEETHAPNSLNEELEITKLPWFSLICCKGV